MILFLAVLFSLPCSIAYAGAWPREKGAVFLSLSQNFSHYGDGRLDGYRSLYFEYGVTPKLTFGAKLWQRADRRHGDILAFVRYPIDDPDGEHRFALGFGFGARHYSDGRVLPVFQSEASWGKGFVSPLGDGWMSLEAIVGQAIGGTDRWTKLDFTFGLKPDKKTHLIMQVRGIDEGNNPQAILAPTYVRQVTDLVKLEVGMTYRFEGDNRLGAILGTWIEF